jgi:hypothetical protein
MKRNLLIILSLIILLLVAGCAEVVCNKPYIQVGTSCCLDQNDNAICDSDESAKTESIKETSSTNSDLITTDVSKLGLYSNEVYAGYSLNIKSSGIYDYNLPDLEKTFVTSYVKPRTDDEGTRWLTFYSMSFENVEGAIEGFKNVTNKISNNPMYEKQKWANSNFGDEGAIFLKKYDYDFSPYKKYAGYIRVKNVVTEIILNIPSKDSVDDELSNYMERLEKKIIQDNSPSSEINPATKSEIGLKNQNPIEIKVNTIERKTSVKKAEGYGYYDIKYLAGTGKNYLILNLGISNIGLNKFNPNSNSFILIDEKGNYYTADWRSFVLEGSKDKFSLNKGQGVATAYFFKVYSDMEKFTLKIYDKDHLEVHSEKLFEEEKVELVCDAKDYILINGKCCLDKNDNSVCDDNEKNEKNNDKELGDITVIGGAATQGDTFMVSTGNSIKLLGITSPERGNPSFITSTQILSKIVSGQVVTFEKDVTSVASNGDLLRYAFVDGKLINKILLEEGHVSLDEDSVNIKYKEELEKAQESAKTNKLGIWS